MFNFDQKIIQFVYFVLYCFSTYMVNKVEYIKLN